METIFFWNLSKNVPSIITLKLPLSPPPFPNFKIISFAGILSEASPWHILLLSSIWERFTDEYKKEREEAKTRVGSVWIWGSLKSLQMVIAAMKLKDAYSLQVKLWPP